MSMFDRLDAGVVAVCGRTGSGKSTIFHGSQYVLDVCIADTGSIAHRKHHQGGGECLMVHPSNRQRSPIHQVREFVERCEREKRIWCLDSWSALEGQQVAWMKPQTKAGFLSLPDHKVIVGLMRDLAFELALGHGFVLFNTSPGGFVKQDDGTVIDTPKGALVGYPALAGTNPGSETILARFSSVWVVTPGGVVRDKESGEVRKVHPRGFLVNGLDPRPEIIATYTPLKDAYAVIRRGEVPEGNGVSYLDVHPFEQLGTCTVDKVLESIPEPLSNRVKPKGKRGKPDQAEPSRNGEMEPAPAGVE